MSHLFNKETRTGYFHVSHLKAASSGQLTHDHIASHRHDCAFFHVTGFLWWFLLTLPERRWHFEVLFCEPFQVNKNSLCGIMSLFGLHVCLQVQLSSVQPLNCVWLFATPRTAAMPGLPVHHQLPEFTQTHVHWVGDAIQPSHPLLSPSPPTSNLSQHQGLFKWVSSSHQVSRLISW